MQRSLASVQKILRKWLANIFATLNFQNWNAHKFCNYESIYRHKHHHCTYITFKTTWTYSWDVQSPLTVFRNATYWFTSFYVITVNCRAKLVGVRSSNFQVSVCTVVVFVCVWCWRACGCVIGQFKFTQWFLIVAPLSRNLITQRFELWVYRSKAKCWTVIREQVVTSNSRSCNRHVNFSSCAT